MVPPAGLAPGHEDLSTAAAEGQPVERWRPACREADLAGAGRFEP